MDENYLLSQIKFLDGLVQWCMECIELIIPEIHKFKSDYKDDDVKVAEEIRKAMASGKIDYRCIGIEEGDREHD